ncbi:hypothetical protein K488DRAFT_69985 [Vararia minispora EC-137]|uniref:Uncharacterized protein n=1 Tax=Vararia minispora EC-137 TaxID=1314806 RepID=A0ACB8QNI4_9AGAM|nr:hypothetical protein K488DRAFT_69985 [Vararia minispora EC-137]
MLRNVCQETWGATTSSATGLKPRIRSAVVVLERLGKDGTQQRDESAKGALSLGCTAHRFTALTWSSRASPARKRPAYAPPNLQDTRLLDTAFLRGIASSRNVTRDGEGIKRIMV